MTPRLSRSEYEQKKGDGNRRAMRALVDAGRVPGLLGFLGTEPVGWVSLEPRAVFPRLASSRVLAPVDDAPVWSIVCLFVAKPHRRSGISVRLLRAAVDWARSRGASIVEGYPVEPRLDTVPDVFAWTGIVSAFETAGFREVLRRSEGRPIMRRRVRPR
jgi:GNAT superfamily N-acetyltransferase